MPTKMGLKVKFILKDVYIVSEMFHFYLSGKGE